MKVHIMMILAALALSVPGGAAQAQKYPSKPVRVIVGFAAGGGTDIAARVIAQKLADAFGSPFVVDNRPGAAGNLAADLVAKSPPDGYALLMANSTIAIPSLFAKLPFDVRKDFTPLSNIALGPSVLSVHPSLPARNVKGLIALARARPSELTYGSGGLGSSTHFVVELFTSMADINMLHTAYKGDGPSVTDVVAGHIPMAFPTIAAANSFIKSGQVKPLAVSTAARSAFLPDVPTVAESGLPGFDVSVWLGIFAPPDTPKEIVARLNAELGKVARQQNVRERLASLGAEPMHSSSEQFSSYVRSEIVKWTNVAKAAKMPQN